MTGPKSCVYRFSDVEVREAELKVIRGGKSVALEPKSFRLLVHLLHSPGHLFTKDELLDAVWGDIAVTESSLTRAMALLRRALEDDPHQPRFIETVSTAGYRFICPVEVDTGSSTKAGSGTPSRAEIGDAAVSASTDLSPAPLERQPPIRAKRLVITASAAIGLVGSTVWYVHRPLPAPRIAAYTQITHDGRQKSLAGTDGTRLYFTDWTRNWIAQVGINGGEIARVPVALPGAKIALIDNSPDAASALIYTIEEGHYPNGQWVVPVLGGAAKRLEDGAEGAFSPDGSSVIYSTLGGDIFMTRIDGNGKHKLASVGPQPFSIFPNPAMFQWSPDRKVIRFGMQDGLWEMSTDGAGIHRLLSGWKGGVSEGGRWTQDGDFFVFASDGQIWAIDERSGPFRRPSSAPIQLTSGPLHWDRPIPGRDGKTIFAEGSTPRGELMRIDPKTGASQPFLDGISAEFVSFSPDGHFVAYVTFPENTLWRANRDGSSRMQLTRPAPNQIFEPRWSPDSKEILFGMYSLSDDRDSMHRVSASDGNPLWLKSEQSENCDDPNWSPDGTRVVFAQGRKNAPEKMDLRIVDLNTRQVIIVPGSAGKWAPRWSPDGRYIAALVNPQMNHVPIFDLKLQRWFDIPVDGEVQYESFSHDGKFIYFMRYGKEQGVFRVPVTGGKEERVVNLAGWHLTSIWGYSMRLDPTDAPLVLRDASSDDIYALTLESK